MSFIETDGRSARFLTRAQNWAITIESAPRSSKKWLLTDTSLTCTTPASTSAKAVSVRVVVLAYWPSTVGAASKSVVGTGRSTISELPTDELIPQSAVRVGRDLTRRRQQFPRGGPGRGGP